MRLLSADCRPCTILFSVTILLLLQFYSSSPFFSCSCSSSTSFFFVLRLLLLYLILLLFRLLILLLLISSPPPPLSHCPPQVSQSLTYFATLDKHVNRFDRISNSEMHILNKLNVFLSYARSDIIKQPRLGKRCLPSSPPSLTYSSSRALVYVLCTCCVRAVIVFSRLYSNAAYARINTLSVPPSRPSVSHRGSHGRSGQHGVPVLRRGEEESGIYRYAIALTAIPLDPLPLPYHPSISLPPYLPSSRFPSFPIPSPPSYLPCETQLDCPPPPPLVHTLLFQPSSLSLPSPLFSS